MPNDPYVITRPAQVEALASPVRQEILDTLSAVGPSPIREIAHLLGRTRHSLYYHFRALTECGLLIQEIAERTDGREEAVFRTPSPLMCLQRTARNRATYGKALDALLRVARADLRRALESSADTLSQPRTLWVGRAQGWVTSEQLERINACIDQIVDLLGRGRMPAGGHLHSVTWAHMPLSADSAEPEGGR